MTEARDRLANQVFKTIPQLPPLMVDLIRERRWRHPGDDVIARVAPCLESNLVDFFLTKEQFESHDLECDRVASDPPYSEIFNMYSSGITGEERSLPWVDVDRAVMIAYSRDQGCDSGILLDFRSAVADPRVLASQWKRRSPPPNRCEWVIVAESLSRFIDSIGL